LTARPTRAAEPLIKNPASVNRIVKESGCLKTEPVICRPV
jgi:hypothetical protein